MGWSRLLDKFLLRQGFHQSKYGYTLFIKSSSGTSIAILVYVDDMLITGNDSSSICSLKQALYSAFTIKDLGFMSIFLGIEVSRSA